MKMGEVEFVRFWIFIVLVSNDHDFLFRGGEIL